MYKLRKMVQKKFGSVKRYIRTNPLTEAFENWEKVWLTAMRAGTGIFVSLVTNSTPLSVGEWRLSNLMTAKSLLTIANHSGLRCCKRNTYLAIKEAVNFVKLNFDITIKTKKRYSVNLQI